MSTTTTRNATLQDLAAMLEHQHARKLDLVVPANQLRAEGACLRVNGSEPVLTDDGVTMADGLYVPTRVCDDSLANKLGIPQAYLATLRDRMPTLYDQNVNGWLDVDERSFLLRTFKPDEGEDRGIARAFLSDRYAVIDHLDALTAALQGVKDAGVEINIVGADLTDRRMTVRISAPQVQAFAPTLLRGYRSPFNGANGTDNPTVFAGLEITNSETGTGAYTIVPRVIVQICTNGMKVTKDAMRAVHLGGKMDDGIVRWSEDTQQKQLELITAKTRDAVATFLDVDYVTKAVAALEAKAGEPVASVEAVTEVTKRLGFTKEQQQGILGQFIQGGQMTLGGVANAATAYAQTVDDGDDAYAIETKAASILVA